MASPLFPNLGHITGQTSVAHGLEMVEAWVSCASRAAGVQSTAETSLRMFTQDNILRFFIGWKERGDIDARLTLAAERHVEQLFPLQRVIRPEAMRQATCQHVIAEFKSSCHASKKVIKKNTKQFVDFYVSLLKPLHLHRPRRWQDAKGVIVPSADTQAALASGDTVLLFVCNGFDANTVYQEIIRQMRRVGTPACVVPAEHAADPIPRIWGRSVAAVWVSHTHLCSWETTMNLSEIQMKLSELLARLAQHVAAPTADDTADLAALLVQQGVQIPH